MKNIIVAIILLLTFCNIAIAEDVCDNCHSDTPLQHNAVRIAMNYDGLTELTNNNDGPEITEWLYNTGLGPGYAYCAAFMYSMYKESRDFLHLSNNTTLPYRSARVSKIYYNAKQNPLKYKVITPNEIALGLYTLEEGDIPIWTRSPSGIENFNGHTGLVIKQIDKNTFVSIEGNTRSDNRGDQGEGGGVFIKTRFIKDYSFKLKGFIRLR